MVRQDDCWRWANGRLRASGAKSRRALVRGYVAASLQDERRIRPEGLDRLYQVPRSRCESVQDVQDL